MKLNWILFLLAATYCSPKQKIAYVNTGRLIENYKGIAEAKSLHFQRTQDVSKLLDSLKNELILAHRSQNEQKARSIQITLNRTEGTYKQNINFIESALFEGALAQINSFVENYAERNGIDIVLGSTLEGNIMYARPEMDITEQVLRELNESYIN